MKILGIDPAPSKNSVVFDGKEFKEYNVNNLKKFIKSFKDNEVLICWDAPLDFDINFANFYYRPIELFFKANNKKENDYQVELPKGISMSPIAGCPHWLMSQYVIGYPAIYYQNNEIFLIRKEEDLQKHQQNRLKIIEVHPALAIWIWLKEEKDNDKKWQYKKDKKVFKEILELLLKKEIISYEDKNNIINYNDDYLDSYIAWKLGYMLINNPEKVMLLDNMLLPIDYSIKEKYENFLKYLK